MGECPTLCKKGGRIVRVGEGPVEYVWGKCPDPSKSEITPLNSPGGSTLPWARGDEVCRARHHLL